MREGGRERAGNREQHGLFVMPTLWCTVCGLPDYLVPHRPLMFGLLGTGTCFDLPLELMVPQHVLGVVLQAGAHFAPGLVAGAGLFRGGVPGDGHELFDLVEARGRDSVAIKCEEPLEEAFAVHQQVGLGFPRLR